MTRSVHVPVSVRLSAYQIGDKEKPRYVWSIGIPVEFVDQLGEKYRRMRLSAHDGVLSLHLSDEGIKISVPPRGRMAWAGSIGQYHIKGLTLPAEQARSIPLEGIFIPEECRIEISRNLPPILKQAIQDVTDLEHASDPKQHFPATHFQEDIAAAEAHNINEPLAELAERFNEIVAIPGHEGDETLPVNLAEWSDDNVRRLRELVRDMLAQRPDVIISTDGETVRFQRQMLIDL
jgi:hypothetical protein